MLTHSEKESAGTSTSRDPLIPRTPTDLNNLWERWDQARKSQISDFKRQKIYSALLGLAVSVLAVKLIEPRSFGLLGDLLLLACGLVGTFKAINILRQQMACR